MASSLKNQSHTCSTATRRTRRALTVLLFFGTPPRPGLRLLPALQPLAVLCKPADLCKPVDVGLMLTICEDDCCMSLS